MTTSPSNRQLKVLRFLDETMPDCLSRAEAHRKITELFEKPQNKEKWHKYVLLTQDFGARSSDLLPYDQEALERVELPSGKTIFQEQKNWRIAFAESIVKEEHLFDDPAPEVVFQGRVFVLTGEFASSPRDQGGRRKLEDAIAAKGGSISDADYLFDDVDFLVVGSKGNPQYKQKTRGVAYGRKVIHAVIERSLNGQPAIIREARLCEFL
jgi:hypothetical protein